MGVIGNGSTAAASPGDKQTPGSERHPRRLVLLSAGEESEVKQVLAEYVGGVKGSQLHAELQRLAADHPGVHVAAEWQGSLGWTRFLWCQKK